jgi:hypothetical protein
MKAQYEKTTLVLVEKNHIIVAAGVISLNPSLGGHNNIMFYHNNI